jgi:hypothetical protein
VVDPGGGAHHAGLHVLKTDVGDGVERLAAGWNFWPQAMQDLGQGGKEGPDLGFQDPGDRAGRPAEHGRTSRELEQRGVPEVAEQAEVAEQEGVAEHARCVHPAGLPIRLRLAEESQPRHRRRIGEAGERQRLVVGTCCFQIAAAAPPAHILIGPWTNTTETEESELTQINADFCDGYDH